MNNEMPPTMTAREEIAVSHKQLMSLLEDKPDNSVLSKDEIANIRYELKKIGAASKLDGNSDLEHKYSTVIGVLGTLPSGDIKRMLNQISDQENL